MSEVAPIALFAYRRPDHLRRTVEALRQNILADQSPVYVFCDAARSEAERDDVERVRAYAYSIEGFRSVEVIAAAENRGLADSIISGVTEVLAKHGRVIVVEDDLVTSPHFLTYMNDGLQLYADEPRVASIHGYVYPVAGDLPNTFFMRGADCWGWATWSRAWSAFEPDGTLLLDRLTQKGLTRAFDMDGSFQYTNMLRDQIAGRNNSWAIRWHAATFVRDMLTLYPGHTLVENIGFDSSGTHCGVSDVFAGAVSDQPIQIAAQPISESQIGRAAFIEYFRRTQPAEKSRWGRALEGLSATWRRLTSASAAQSRS